MAYLKEFSIIPVSSVNQRALNQSIEILKSKGVKMVELDINDIVEDLTIFTNACFF